MVSADTVIVNGVLAVVRKEKSVTDLEVLCQYLYGEAK
jgi:hypothetical protein